MNEEQNTTPLVTEVTEVVIVKETPSNNKSLVTNLKLSTVGFGLLSALLVIGVSAAVTGIVNMPTFTYGIPPVLSVALLVVYILGFIMAAFGPAVWLGSRHGLRKGLFIVGAEFLWFILLFSVYYLTNPNPALPMSNFGF